MNYEGRDWRSQCRSWHSFENQPNPRVCLSGRSPAWCRVAVMEPVDPGGILLGQCNVPPWTWASSWVLQFTSRLWECYSSVKVASSCHPILWPEDLRRFHEKHRMVPIDSENSVDLSCRKLFLSVLEIALSRSPPVTLQSTKLCLWTWRRLGDCIPVVRWTQKNLSSVASGCVHSCWK